MASGFQLSDLPDFVRRGMVTQESADKLTGRAVTASAEAIRKETAKARARKNADIERDGKYSLLAQLSKSGIPSPEWEITFSDHVKSRFDGAYVDRKIAIEIEGGIDGKSRHTTPLGYERDCVKYNTAALLGWRVFRFTYGMIRDGRAAETIARAYFEGDAK